MLRRLLPTLCTQRSVTLLRQQTRRSSYFCFNTAMPVIPACYWTTMPNGVRVITEQTANPLACVMLIAEAGSRFENARNNGASHFFEHMAYRGLCTLSRCSFEELVREMGAHLTVHTDREYQAFIATCPHESINCIMNLFSRMFSELQISPLEMECAINDINVQLTEIDKNQKKLCLDYLHQTAFQGTPLALAPIGPSTNYDSFDGRFLQSFIDQHYQPFRLILSVSSIFSHQDVVCMAQSSFGCMKKTTNELVDWPCRYTGSAVRFRDDDLPFCHIAIAVETGGYMSKDYLTLQMMKHIIGKWDESQCQGYSTWPKLAHAAAASKLLYRYEAFYLPYRDIGLWGVYFVIKKEDDFEDAILMIQDQWMSLCTITAFPDVQRATASLKLELAKKVDGCVSSCLDMGLQLLYWGHRQTLIELYEVLDCTKQLDIRDRSSQIIYDRCPVLAAVGPTEGVPDYNRLRAGMYWLRL